jgi:hypothetical protein
MQEEAAFDASTVVFSKLYGKFSHPLLTNRISFSKFETPSPITDSELPVCPLIYSFLTLLFSLTLHLRSAKVPLSSLILISVLAVIFPSLIDFTIFLYTSHISSLMFTIGTLLSNLYINLLYMIHCYT